MKANWGKRQLGNLNKENGVMHLNDHTRCRLIKHNWFKNVFANVLIVRVLWQDQ